MAAVIFICPVCNENHIIVCLFERLMFYMTFQVQDIIAV